MIIGDSFCMSYKESKTRPNEEYCFWGDYVKSKLNGSYEIIIDAQPSRDSKTILENTQTRSLIKAHPFETTSLSV